MATFLPFCVLLTAFCSTVIWVEADKGELRTLHRQKREWIVPPKQLYENVDYTNEKFIAKIRSDEETRENIVYSLLGSAADEGLFSVGKKDGYVKIHGILDREKTAFYELKGRASLTNGVLAEKDLNLKIIVLDQNDNAPEFKFEVTGSVDELSDVDTYIISITAVDIDEQDTLHSQIVYNVIQQEPAGEKMFKIDRTTGQIKVRINTLDRETHETYRLLITGTDMNGGVSDNMNRPLTGTGTVIINISDVNDNIPKLEESSYVGSVEENIKHVEVIRIKTIDLDKIYTENWEAVYTIISGNEAGYFNITTDRKTNEGILMVKKELNYEELKEVHLKVVVNNKAAYHKSVVIGSPQTYPIKINVLNVPEAPHFQPAVKVIYVSENSKTIDLTKVITTYKATDSDTMLIATNVRYVKGEDVDNWVSINEKTSEIKLNKYPDRESKHLINGTYYIKILAITDSFTQKTATGTLAIQVEDYNDHCPVLTSSVEMMCYGSSVVYVTAMDGDHFPNAEPFDFTLVTEDSKKWSIEHLNATTSILRSHEEILWPGLYTVELEVKDQQGKSCEVQKLQVSVCKCTEAQVCKPARRTDRGTVLGPGAILALLLGILLLLLIPLLLLICECGGAAAAGRFQAFPFEQKQQLITYHTEGQGEDKELALMHVPGEGGSGGKGGAGMGAGMGAGWGAGWGAAWGAAWGAGWGAHEHWRKFGWESEEEYIKWLHKHAEYFNATGQSEFFTASTLGSMALSETFFREYYAKKTWESMYQIANTDQFLVSDHEDCISVMSSLDELSTYLHEENNLDFLNDLGPKFRRLGKICAGSDMELEVSSSPTPDINISSGSQVGVNVKGAVDVVHNEATSVSASSSSSTTQITTTNYAENVSSGGATSAATVGQTVFIQQPPVYLSSTPMYVVEQQRQPALFLASGQILGVQEQKVVLVEKGTTNMAIGAENTLPGLRLQQANTRVLVDPGIGGTLVRGFSGRSEPEGTVSGTFRVMERQRVESTEPAHVMQSSSHSSIRKSQHIQIEGQSGGSLAIGNASGFPNPISVSQKDLFSVPNDGTHQEVREKRVSVVKKSFQSSSMSTS
ncbi:desmoglein-2-like isoform X1 [Tachysurus fulvidraco]|uniref:desmoglein-2-like isoform X1 n=1 Tax=Tachysurus fulvidraco TaxID=1234273 RepID=UPI001FEFB3C2|nr:desmoglein-2-like isoform X1 [Tachysurus fulvidraco]